MLIMQIKNKHLNDKKGVRMLILNLKIKISMLGPKSLYFFAPAHTPVVLLKNQIEKQ